MKFDFVSADRRRPPKWGCRFFCLPVSSSVAMLLQSRNGSWIQFHSKEFGNFWKICCSPTRWCLSWRAHWPTVMTSDKETFGNFKAQTPGEKGLKTQSYSSRLARIPGILRTFSRRMWGDADLLDLLRPPLLPNLDPCTPGFGILPVISKRGWGDSLVRYWYGHLSGVANCLSFS